MGAPSLFFSIIPQTARRYKGGPVFYAAFSHTLQKNIGQPESRPTAHYKSSVQRADGVYRAPVLLRHLGKLLLCALQLPGTQGLGQGIGGRIQVGKA